MAACSRGLLAGLAALEVLLFQQAFVNQLQDIVELEGRGRAHGAHALLTLLSVLNFCLTLLHVLAVQSVAGRPGPGATHALLGALQAAASGWFLVKISFAASLLLVLTVGGAGGTERSWLLFILGCACGLLVLCRLLVRDLTVLSLPEPRPGGAHYKLLPTGPGRAEHV